MLRVASVNVNGIRAAARRDGLDWIRNSGATLTCLQEVRASSEEFTKTLADCGLGHLHVAHSDSQTAGRAGVAIVSDQPLCDIRIGCEVEEFDLSGRWIEATADTPIGKVTAVSVYVHTGEADTGRQAEKYRFLDAMDARMRALQQQAEKQDSHVVVCGDFNIAHTERDIKNWRGNRGKAGFLPEEQAYLSRWAEAGWVDTGRAFAGDVNGPYTWWSWRGKAYDTDAGWRIDYVMATPTLAEQLKDFQVARANTYAQRWSDHAPIVADFRPKGSR